MFRSASYGFLPKCFGSHAIIGNPPYQVLDGGNAASAVPVYNRFVGLAKSLNPKYLSMIIPAKWYNGGKGLDAFRKEMLSDKHLACLFDYIDGHDCFPTVDIAGGICYFLRDADHNGLCRVTTQQLGERIITQRELDTDDVFIRHTKAITILEKIKKLTSSFLTIYPRKPFGLPTNARPTSSGNIKLRYNGGIGVFQSDLVDVNTNLIEKWKVITSRLTVEHAGKADKSGQKRIISTLEILEPNTVCAETYLLLATFDTKNESLNFYNYIKTRFVRCLISMITSTQQLSRTNFRFVPVQDFTHPWTDADLYAKYSLTADEIDYIERTTKAM